MSRNSRLWAFPHPQLPNDSMNITNMESSNPSKEPTNTGTRLNKNWRKAVDSVRTLVSTTTKDRAPSAATAVSPHASEAAAATLTKDLRQALFGPGNGDGGWATRHHPSRYRTVQVLLTYWAETDDPAFGAAGAARALADVFRRRYGFDVLVWLIPVLQPQQALAAKLRQFARDFGQQPGSLLIFWYGGSAREERQGIEGSGGPVLWFGESFGGPTINSQIVPQILGAGKADVLTLYDSPHALHGYNVTGSGLCEHLGAGAHDGVVAGFVASGNGNSDSGPSLSFTRALIRVLDKPDRAARGLSVLDIHRKLVNRYQMAAAASAAVGAARSSSSSSESSEGKEAQTRKRESEESYVPRTQPWLPNALRQTPVYCHLSRCRQRSQGGPASIVVSQLGQEVAHQDPDDEDDDDGTVVEVSLRLCLRTRNNNAQAVVNLERWKEWILDAPPEASQLDFIQATAR